MNSSSPLPRPRARKSTSARELRHPLLRVAMRDDGWTRVYQTFNRQLRATLASETPESERVEIAQRLLRQLGDLQLDPGTADAFRLEWLRLLADELEDPVVQLALGSAELANLSLRLSAPEWDSALPSYAKFAPPELQEPSTLSKRSFRLAPPTEASDAWERGVRLTLEAVGQGAHLLRIPVQLDTQFGNEDKQIGGSGQGRLIGYCPGLSRADALRSAG